MRAVIIATGESPGIKPLDDHYPVPLLPLVDRPFIQHVVEFCAAQGVSRFDFVLSRFPEKIEHHLEDGTRWGSKFNFHLVRDPSIPYRILKALDWSGDDGPILFGHADRLPLFPLREVVASTTPPVLFSCRGPDDSGPALRQRTGWALLLSEHLAGLPAGADEAVLHDHLLKSGAASIEVPRPLDVRTFGELLASHQAVLAKNAPGLFLSGHEADPGVWLSRNVRLHPTVQFFPPVFVGENCDIGPGVRLGPDAVLGKDCMLDGHCTVTNSVVFPNSYVGEGLELADVIVDRNRLISARHGEAVAVSDNFILGSMSERHLSQGLARLLARVTALAALLVASPLLLAIAVCLKLFRRGPVVYRKEVVRLPAAPEADARTTFAIPSFSPLGDGSGAWERGLCSFRGLWLRFLPALVSVARGDLALVGVPPRSREEIKRLPQDWQALYLRSKAGIVTEASVRFTADLTDDDLYAADAFYVASAGWGYDLKLLVRYLSRSLFGGLLPKRSG
jgi:NDP-sugar pyrophosphorylase family protein